MNQSIRLVLAAMLLTVAAPAMASATYTAEIRTTSFGIPHIKANDYGSLGFGYGYAYASQNICILAREVVEANGQQSLHFGETTGRNEQDFFYTLVNTDAFIDQFAASLSAEALAAIRGYAAGYSRYLADTGKANLPLDCRDEDWVRAIDERDMLRVFYKLILRASGGQLVGLINDAAPPAAQATPGAADSQQIKRQIMEADWSPLRDLRRPFDLGSNMYALGANATQSGKGMVLGNPHFPWSGPLRWYQVHLTIPGELDVMGASLHGVPLVNIGFNQHVAWSHTVSPAWRFTLYELALVPGQPLKYFYDGAELDFEVYPVSIEVTDNLGDLQIRNHTFYRSVQGWVLDFNDVLGFPLWNNGQIVYALGDANEDNLRAIEQFLQMNKAQSLSGFIAALTDNVGLPWVHTVAADAAGNAFFGDVSVVPHVDQAKLSSCPGPILGAFLSASTGLIALDGSQSACAWGNDPDAPQDGIFGASNLPTLQTQDYVTNSNDNHWLSNPDIPLTGFSPLFGAEQTQRSLRTRLGILQVQQRLAGSDGLGAPGYTLATLQDALFGSRNYMGELIAAELAVLCADEGPTVDLGGGDIVDVSQACTVLANWDQKQNVDSVGAQVMLEFLLALNDADGDDLFTNLFATPFDVNDPVNTPSGLANTDPADRTKWMQHLAEGVKNLNDNGIALDAVWGSIQYEEKNTVQYPIHGGRDGSGMFSIITANLQNGLGYTPVRHGNSYMQTVTWDVDDNVQAEALLSYSQSSDPANPHYADQTALYSNKQWVALPFTDAEIEADPNYSTLTLTQPINIDTDSDGILDANDNCTEVANPAQIDTDGDGYGNFCDPDLNNDGLVNFIDLTQLKGVFFSNDANADFDGSGQVNFGDLVIMKSMFFGPPGPSCTVP
ncbi:MAG: hypothetical protein HKN49_12780 [Gammaproteobacteria bacterium]|nr:hypothetical protein [Gammaproteobacteria bacterium]